MSTKKQRALSKIKSRVRRFHHTLKYSDADDTVTHGLILISSVIPAVMEGRKRFENRTFQIKPGYYALYGSADKKPFRKRFLEEHPEEDTPDFLEKVKKVEKKIVGVIEVHRSFKRGSPDYPVDPHANGEYTHSITFTPLPEQEYISGAYKKGQVTYMTLDPYVSRKLSSLKPNHVKLHF